MLLVKTDNAVAAWRKALAVLLADQSNEENDKYFRDQPMAIELRQATLEKADPLFPMSQEDLDIINRFIYTGEKEEQ
ncbi:MAG: hypothetical protein K8F91_22005, partial [Candidatus Obscuribacterales bacterium]|nr:hypothetical protein [Candidatus Obscuribacterales bacterium]